VTKLHQICYLSNRLTVQDNEDLIAVSTEDGRIIFYSSKEAQKSTSNETSIPNAVAKGQLEHRSGGGTGRIKDFEILDLPRRVGSTSDLLIVTGSSSGEVRIWAVPRNDLKAKGGASGEGTGETNGLTASKQVGRMLGTYETGNRITCLRAFMMNEPDEDNDNSFEDFDNQDDETSDDHSSESDEG
jgi:protein MAK11